MFHTVLLDVGVLQCKAYNLLYHHCYFLRGKSVHTWVIHDSNWLIKYTKWNWFTVIATDKADNCVRIGLPLNRHLRSDVKVFHIRYFRLMFLSQKISHITMYTHRQKPSCGRFPAPLPREAASGQLSVTPCMTPKTVARKIRYVVDCRKNHDIFPDAATF